MFPLPEYATDLGVNIKIGEGPSAACGRYGERGPMIAKARGSGAYLGDFMEFDEFTPIISTEVIRRRRCVYMTKIDEHVLISAGNQEAIVHTPEESKEWIARFFDSDVDSFFEGPHKP